MKSVSCLLTGVTLLFVATPSVASFFEVCNVTAKVVAIEELSVFGGSASVPAGVNPDGKEVYSYMKLLALEVLNVEALGCHTDCKKMLIENHSVILDSLESKNGLGKSKVGDLLKLIRTKQNGLTPGGIAYGESWTLQ